MMEPLTFSVAASNAFEGRPVNVYQASDGTVWLSREQIGQALGYSDPGIAIGKIHARHRERLDCASMTVRSEQDHDASGDNLSPEPDENDASLTNLVKEASRSRVLYSPKGVYEICRWSQQPAAEEAQAIAPSTIGGY